MGYQEVISESGLANRVRVSQTEKCKCSKVIQPAKDEAGISSCQMGTLICVSAMCHLLFESRWAKGTGIEQYSRAPFLQDRADINELGPRSMNRPGGLHGKGLGDLQEEGLVLEGFPALPLGGQQNWAQGTGWRSGMKFDYYRKEHDFCENETMELGA